jgi:ankyrin repeat protein
MITATIEGVIMSRSIKNKRSDSPTSLVASPKKRIRTISSSTTHRRQQNENDPQSRETSPQEYLMETVKSTGSEVRLSSSLKVKGFFMAPTEKEINAYGIDVLAAVRTRDIAKLREYQQNGRPLKCSNSFGESLLHLACRRGFVDVATFLIKEAGVTVRVIDDYGRTPMHDACWTCEPNFELLELIMTACPDLLFMKDRRGHTPLEYARREHWGVYVTFLKERQELFCRDKS